MRAVQIVSFLSLCLSCLATYGSDSNQNHGSGGFKPILEGRKIHLDEAKIHLNSPKILLDRPKIHVQDSNHSPLHEDEPIILENERPLYIRKTLHGIPSGRAVGIPVIINSGYGERGLDYDAPVEAVRVVQHPTVIHEQPILIRRPVVVTRDLIATQDHLEKTHYDQLKYGQAGLVHAGLVHGLSGLHGLQAIPIAKGLHERTLVYGDLGHGLAHGYGHAAIPVSAYNVPLLTQQKALGGHSSAIRYGTGKEIYSSGNLKKY